MFTQNIDCIFMGYFNHGKVHFKTFHSLNAEGSRLVTFIEDNFYIQKVHEPTQFDNNLNFIFTNNKNLVKNVEVGEHLANSDYKIIRFILKICVNV